MWRPRDSSINDDTKKFREIIRAFTYYQQVHSCNWYIKNPCLEKRKKVFYNLALINPSIDPIEANAVTKRQNMV
jgi:hypothetical protein